jgi:hypothetical protein
MRFVVTAFTLVTTSVLGAQGTPKQRIGTAVAIVGDWQLNLARTHYGAGVDRRRSERFSCATEANRVRCVIRSIRADGRVLTGRFVAPTDGTGAPVAGIPDVDQVQLRPSSAFADVTFLSRGRPVYGYRAFQSQDGRSLMIVSVDPVSRVAQTTVVVYDRR